jgi:hypothetical protein
MDLYGFTREEAFGLTHELLQAQFPTDLGNDQDMCFDSGCPQMIFDEHVGDPWLFAV